MKKLLKTLISIIVVLILLFIIAGVCLVLFLDPNKFKEQISSVVHDKTGRELVINGDIERSFFPWLGLRIHDVRMSNAPGFTPEENFITVGEADVSVKLLSLLSGKVEIGNLVLKDLQLNLAENKQGQTNWQDLKALASSHHSDTHIATMAKARTETPHTNAEPSTPPKFSVEGIEVKNADITWVNQKNGQSLELSKLNLSSKNIGINKPFPLSLNFEFRGNKPQIAAQFALDTDATLAPQNLYRLGKLRFSAQLLDKSVPKVQLEAESVVVNLQQQTLSIANALLSAANLTAKTNLEAASILTKPEFNGRIDIAQFNLKDFLKAFGKTINTEDPEALQKAALSTNFVGDTSALKLSSILGHLDDSTLQGSVNISSFAGKALNFALYVNQVNLDRYMPVKSAPVTATTAAISTRSSNSVNKTSSADPGSFEALRQANISGTVKIDALTVSKTQLTQIAGQISVKNGIVEINPLTANVYQGTTISKLTADLRGSVPRMNVDEKLSNVQVSQLMKSERLTGSANIIAHLTMMGSSQQEILRSLNGTTEFNIQNGALLGVDLPYELNRAAALIKKQPGPAQPSTGRTNFQQFSGSGVFQNGVFNNQNLLMQSAQLKITGNGTANLVSQTLNYHLSAEQPGNPVLGNTALPLLITGTFSKPIITPDIEAVARELLKSGIKTRIEERIGGGGRAGALLNRLLER
ncbi:MAG TPA: AsmA family protein [Gammaproteobacteria bacterium]|nr:AsmA family protein [Gammaproteobacteria bacterium]